MAYLRPYFDYDAFVSYSHGVRFGDIDAPLRDWTLELIRRLETGLRLADNEFDGLLIWRDEQIDPTAHLTEQLRANVGHSGILIIVMSPRYLKSAWCTDELEWFKQQIEDRARDVGRVFVIRAMDTDVTRWPDFLRDSRGHPLPGFQFYDKQDLIPYRWQGTNINHEAFVKELWRLQGALTSRLRELRANAERRAKIEAPAPAAAATAGPRRIYLYARSEYANASDEVRTALAQDGIPAISAVAAPGRDIADFAEESRSRMRDARRCSALALLRGDGDKRFIDDLYEIGVDERERIQSALGIPLPCAVLDRSGRSLAFDLSGYGIARFDLGRDDWRGAFRGWLDQGRPQTAAAP
jgi:hypothetical protein